MYKIYLVEDEKSLNDILIFYLNNEGFNCTGFTDGLSASNRIDDLPDLWILDIMLPDIDGFMLLKKIKEHNSDTPIIFISARDHDLDKIAGLELGGDDYIAKPFMPMELVIRTKKLLERTYKHKPTKNQTKEMGCGYILDLSMRKLFKDNKEVQLTSKEFDTIDYLLKNEGIALSRESIIVNIYNDDSYINDRSVDDLIRRIRKKIPEVNIDTIYGYGYRWCSIEK